MRFLQKCFFLFNFLYCILYETYVLLLLQHDLTLDVVILFVAAVIFFITSVFFVMLQLMAGLKIAFFIYSTIIIITVLMVSFKTYDFLNFLPDNTTAIYILLILSFFNCNPCSSSCTMRKP